MRAAMHTVGGLSACADQAALVDWAGAFRTLSAWTFVVHGESPAALALAGALRRKLGW